MSSLSTMCETDRILQSRVVESGGAVVSSFWRAAGMPGDSGTPTEWLADLPGLVVSVHCECRSEIAAARFMRRTRHPGHRDEVRTASEIMASIRALVPLRPLGVGELVVADTSAPVDIRVLGDAIAETFVRCRARLAADGAR
jgi:hypothetical protein